MSVRMAPYWNIYLLGGLCARREAHRLTSFETRKAGQLLAYLAYRLGHPHPREILAELFWPEEELGDEEVEEKEGSSRRSLTIELARLRRYLEPDGVPKGAVLTADRFSIELNPEAVTTDVLQFQEAWKVAQRAGDGATKIERLAEAVTIYRGELLPGFYDEWVLSEQEALHEIYLRALRQLVALYEERAEPEEAMQCALRWTHAEPHSEEAHYTLMRLYAATGRPEQALLQHPKLEAALRELNLQPSARTRKLVEEIRRGSGPAGQFPAAQQEKAAQEVAAVAEPQEVEPDLGPVTGAVPLPSRYYVERGTDAEFLRALAAGHSIVLVRGGRQVGKTSLLARGLQHARQSGRRVAWTDVQLLNAACLESADAFLRTVAAGLAEQLDLDARPADFWDPERAPNLNFQSFLRRAVLSPDAPPLVWALDEVDLLFPHPLGAELFSMFRSWHNARALDPSGPWSRLTLAIVYATEPHLFVDDPNLSPWNVGTKLALEDFAQSQVADLNRRYGGPLRDDAEVGRFYRLVGGHPYLVRRGLHEMAGQHIRLPRLEERAAREDWIYGEHLRRVRAVIGRNPHLCDVVRAVLRGQPCPEPDSFHRLQSAGVLTGASFSEARLRCPLYAVYLKQHLL
jgi:DNA-binding SARP family transcriptional activator